MPFKEIDHNLLNISYSFLLKSNIEYYSKLHSKLAYDKIEEFRSKYNLEEVEVSPEEMIGMVNKG